MAIPTYCGRCLRNLGTASSASASFSLLAAHTPTCPKNIADGNKKIPSTVLQDTNPFFPLWSLIQALF